MICDVLTDCPVRDMLLDCPACERLPGIVTFSGIVLPDIVVFCGIVVLGSCVDAVEFRCVEMSGSTVLGCCAVSCGSPVTPVVPLVLIIPALGVVVELLQAALWVGLMLNLSSKNPAMLYAIHQYNPAENKR